MSSVNMPSPQPAKRPRVDVGALAGRIATDATEMLASTVVCAIDWLEEDDLGLGQLQKIELVRAALSHFDGFEISTCRNIREELTRCGVEVWGMAARLEEASGPREMGPREVA